MGPEEAAFAVERFFTHAHTVIPMHYGTYPYLKGTFEEFQKELKDKKVFPKVKLIDCFNNALGMWLDIRNP
jgi:L-ascorbate metabolism protein UlaG (beta-lactamase superfamily)